MKNSDIFFSEYIYSELTAWFNASGFIRTREAHGALHSGATATMVDVVLDSFMGIQDLVIPYREFVLQVS